MKKILCLAMCAVFAAALPARAQSDEYRDAVAEMMELTGALRNADVVVTQMIGYLKTSAPSVSEAVWEKIISKFNEKMRARMVDIYVPIYSKYLTLADLRELNALYAKPVMRKAVGATPAIMQEGMSAGAALGQEIMTECSGNCRPKDTNSRRAACGKGAACDLPGSLILFAQLAGVFPDMRFAAGERLGRHPPFCLAAEGGRLAGTGGLVGRRGGRAGRVGNLQQRRKDAHKAIPRRDGWRGGGTIRRGWTVWAVCQVVFEYGGHAACEFAVVDEGVDLEIVLEAAEIHVCGADHREHVVDDQQFGVQEPRGVERNFHPAFIMSSR